MNKILTMPSLWAILPDRIKSVQHAYITHLKGDLSHSRTGAWGRESSRVEGEKAEIWEGVPKAGFFDVDIDKIPESFFMDGDIAIMQIDGVITPKADIWSRIFGGSSLDVMTRDFNTLINDDSVKAIVLDIDSPGGVAFGIEQFASLVFDAKEIKPVVSITSTMMTSAAMWIGAAAEEVFITGEVVVTGSIGVVITHIDISELEKMLGIKTTEITAGKFKRISSIFKPLSEEGRTELQGQVNHVQDVFVSDIARFRGAHVDIVNADMADGRTFIGSQGIQAGLIDEIISTEDLIDRINSRVGTRRSVSLRNNLKGGTGMSVIVRKKGMEIISAETLKEEYPHIYNEVFESGARHERDGINGEIADAAEKARIEGQKQGETIGAKSERERIMAVEEQLVPGQEKLIARLKADGVTTGPEAAIAVIKAEKELREKGLKDFVAQGAKAVAVENEIETEEVADEKGEKDFRALVAKYRIEHNCSKVEAMKAIARSHPEEHKKYKNQ